MTLQTGLAVAGITIVAIVSAYLGDKATSRETANDRVHLVYWEKWTGAEADAMRKIVKQFNNSQDRVTVQYLSISGIESKVMLATAGNNPPDIAGLYLNQVVQYADEHALTDLTGLAKDAGVKESDYIKSYFDASIVNGHLYALPCTPATIALHVRQDSVPSEFATAETFPKTIETFDDLMFKISKKNPDKSLKMAGFLPSSPGWWNWAWAYFFGGSSILPDGTPCVDSPENIKAFKWIAKYAKEYGTEAVQSFQSGFGGFSSPEDPFLDGKTATEFNGTWKANYINIYSPGLKWFAVPFPHPADRPDLADRTILNQDVLTIPAGAKHPKEAFEFMKFVQRQDVMEGLCSSQGKNSPLEKVSDHFFETHPNHEIRFFDALARKPGAFSQPAVGIFPQINNEMDVAFQEVNTGVKTPEEALHDAQGRLAVIWKTYKTQVLDR